MADPFEVRVRFTDQLTRLNASVSAAQKAAKYALKYRDMDEDLHSCIIERLEYNDPVDMNNRANIMYFIDHFCALAQRENHPEFIRMIQRDINRVIDLVAPSDGSGAANVKVVRRVLQGLQQKQVLLPQTVQELEECLKERDVIQDAAPNGEAMNGETEHRMEEEKERRKRMIEQRIEEDRERHKRLRESIWVVEDEQAEMDNIVADDKAINDDDILAGEEDREERRDA